MSNPPRSRRLFTPEEREILSKNPFTYRVTARQIFYTLEFKNIFLSRYQTGEPTRQIFEDLGYDISILGRYRIHNFASVLMRKAEAGELFTETPISQKADKPVNVDYNTVPAQQSVSAMQRELLYLRQQVEFLKKLTELDNDKKPRT